MSLIQRMAAIAIALAAAPVSAADRHVPADFPTIQAALDAALNGDRVVVAPGRYYETLHFPPRNIHMVSSAGPRLTIIDGQALDTVVTFDGAPGRGAILEGFTLTNGYFRLWENAGGVHIGEGASPTVRGNVIRQNRGSGSGHGVSIYRARSPLIEGNEIRHNSGAGGGGGIAVRHSACAGAPSCGIEIRNNYIGNNYVRNSGSGGGISLSGAQAIITGNVIEFNTATANGGGLSSDSGSSSSLVANNLFYANRSGWFGGGIESSVGQGDRGPVIVNNTFVANEAETGSAIYSSDYVGQSRIANNMISATGSGPALYCHSNRDGVRPIIRYNIVHAPQGSAYAGVCAGSAGIDGNQSVAPVFMGKEDFRLQLHSPGVDEGDSSESTQATDLAGKDRIADGNGDGLAVIDVGAYELPPPTIFANGFEGFP